MFQRGFKTWCEKVSLQQRRELSLRPFDALYPMILAEHLGILVWTPEQIPEFKRRYLDILLKKDPGSWSAVTLMIGERDLTILNSAHSRARQSSSLTHELAHLLIGHKPSQVHVSKQGLLLLSTYNKMQEDEAAWLAGCLLLPRDALLHIRRLNLSLKEAARLYGASQDMLNYRLNVTGVDRQLSAYKRARKARA